MTAIHLAMTDRWEIKWPNMSHSRQLKFESRHLMLDFDVIHTANSNEINASAAQRCQGGGKSASELDTQMTLRNALREAYGYRATEASQYTLATLHDAVLDAYGYKFQGTTEAAQAPQAPQPKGN